MTTVRVVQLFWWQDGSELGQRLFSTPRGGDLTTKDTHTGGGGGGGGECAYRHEQSQHIA